MKTILSAIFTVALVSVLVGAGTFAYYTDTETSSDNTFTAGEMDLVLLDMDENKLDRDGDSVSTSWSMDNMIPGDSIVVSHVTLMNIGNVSAHHIELSFSNTIDESSNVVESDTNPDSVPADLAKFIEITMMSYDGSIFVPDTNNPLLYDSNGNGWYDLNDLTLSPNTDVGGAFDNLKPPVANGEGTEYLTMGLYFRPEATNDIQGDILTTTVTFTLNQDESQSHAPED